MLAKVLFDVNILLVEDDLLLAKGTAKLMERLGGHKVQITADPEKIMQLCQGEKVDIVLMDVNLPGATWEGEEVSGADLSRLLKGQSQTVHIPIIILTAYAMATERETLLNNSQADEFCTKPITDYQSLLDLMARLVAKYQKSE